MGIKRPRDSGAIKELETAEAFLAKGLVRNAAGKAFQALKAVNLSWIDLNTSRYF